MFLDKQYLQAQRDGNYKTQFLKRVKKKRYPIFLANTTSIFKISSPSQSQSSHFEIPVSKHVGETKRVVILLWK